ncbi:MAG: stage III sporulation protein AG [Firmicutes bacterium]|nr:stage III sporulation protein AG [Bacillota bacterium]
MGEKKGSFLRKFTEGKGNPWVIGLLLGLLLLVIAIPTEKSSTDNSGSSGMEQSQTDTKNDVTEEEKVRNLEKRLKQVLAQVEGVGEVEVMITLRSSGEKIVEKDGKNSESKTEQSQSEQEKSSSQSREQEEATVYTRDQDGVEIPYVKEVMEPEVAGVIVAAQGGGDSVVAADITDAVMALFGIEAHKIKVMKKVCN